MNPYIRKEDFFRWEDFITIWLGSNLARTRTNNGMNNEKSNIILKKSTLHIQRFNLILKPTMICNTNKGEAVKSSHFPFQSYINNCNLSVICNTNKVKPWIYEGICPPPPTSFILIPYFERGNRK